MSISLFGGNAPVLRVDRVEQNYANVMAGPEKIAERTKAIQDNPIAPLRWVEMRLFNNIVDHPERYTKRLHINLPATMHFRGSTGHSTIVQNGPYGVMKRVRRASARMSHDERVDLAAQLEGRKAVVEGVLGEYALQQTIALEKHPFRNGINEVIVATTRHYAGKTVEAFGSQRASIDEAEINQLSDEYGIRGQFAELAEGGLELKKKGILVDLSAPGGVVIDLSAGSPHLLLTNEALDHPSRGDFNRIGSELRGLLEVSGS